MVDYREEYLQMRSDINSVHGRRLHPLMPKLSFASGTDTGTGTGAGTNNSTLFSSSYTCSIHNPNNIRPWNLQLPLSNNNCMRSNGGRSEMTRMPLVSTRWNPTPEQLEALEKMYRDGIKTPSAAQIQEIASKLRRFGKIEGKNVFYWFQNHKARERQKKRRHLQLGDHEKKGLSRRNLENGEHPEKQPTLLSNCTKRKKDSESMNGSVVIADCQKDSWTKFYQTQLLPKNEAFWQLDLSSSTIPFSHNHNNNNHKIMAQKISFQDNEKTSKNIEFRNLENDDNIGIYYKEKDQTLELFPIKSSDNLRTLINRVEEETNDVLVVGTKYTPNEFFEFLPIKN